MSLIKQALVSNTYSNEPFLLLITANIYTFIHIWYSAEYPYCVKTPLRCVSPGYILRRLSRNSISSRTRLRRPSALIAIRSDWRSRNCATIWLTSSLSVMTSFAFILGVVPLVIVTGASANSWHSVQTKTDRYREGTENIFRYNLDTIDSLIQAFLKP